jgi:hypothetical protein
LFYINIGNTYSKISPQLPKDIADALSNALSYKIKGAFFSPQFKGGYWDGRIRIFNKTKQTFGTGLLWRVRGTLNQSASSLNAASWVSNPICKSPSKPALVTTMSIR